MGYFVTKDKSKIGYCIRRRIGNKQPRLPKAQYKHLSTLSELKALCVRLNHEEGYKAKQRVMVETSFIPQAILDGFRDMLAVNVPNEKDFRYLSETVLKNYFLNFFINTLKLPDPKQWQKHQEVWGAALLGKSEHMIFDKPPSAKTIKNIVQTANRFMRFLAQKMPEEYTLVRLEPLNRAAIKEHEARRTLVKIHVNRFVSAEDWELIEKELTEPWGCCIKLMYYYGVRRGEALGFTSTNEIKVSHLLVQAQFKDKKLVPVKDREKRKVPHWFCSPEKCYEIIKESLDCKMHPDTLSQHWEKLRTQINVSYDLHDFRRTFITIALRQYPARDVQLAAGHADLRTTMQYAQDDRSLSDQIWKPSA